jgi:hypothetical protein
MIFVDDYYHQYERQIVYVYVSSFGADQLLARNVYYVAGKFRSPTGMYLHFDD